jgi:hypothetical protein
MWRRRESNPNSGEILTGLTLRDFRRIGYESERLQPLPFFPPVPWSPPESPGAWRNVGGGSVGSRRLGIRLKPEWISDRHLGSPLDLWSGTLQHHTLDCRPLELGSRSAIKRDKTPVR